jgi:hypothetical protein
MTRGFLQGAKPDRLTLNFVRTTDRQQRHRFGLVMFLDPSYLFEAGRLLELGFGI